MTVYAPTARTPRVLADLLPRPTARHRALAVDAALVVAGAAVVGALAQAEIPLWPVPITGQTLGVMVVGAALGARRGALAMLTYLLAGLAGAPIFAGATGGIASIAKPSFGFIVGFIAAAWIAGLVAERAWGRRPVLALAGAVVATIVPFLVGVPYMAFMLNVVLGSHLGFAEIMAAGVTPFLIGGAIKALLAAAFIPAAAHLVRRVTRSTRD